MRNSSRFDEGLSALMKNTTLDEQKYYLTFNLLSSAAPYLSDPFVAADFDFYGKTMSGRQEQQPRWKRALSTVNGALSEAVGQMYVAKYFPASSKEKMLKMVGDLQKALGDRISSLEWMSDATKAKAQEKLAALSSRSAIPTLGATTAVWRSRMILIGRTYAVPISLRSIICWRM
mgnify:FL=1